MDRQINLGAALHDHYVTRTEHEQALDCIVYTHHIAQVVVTQP